MDLVTYYDDYWSAKDDSVDYDRLSLLVQRVQPGDRVLDAGCGAGMLSVKLVERGARVTAVDISHVAVRRAVEKGIEATQVDLDTSCLPFADGSFDTVISDSSLEHLFFSRKALQECVRVVRPGGRFLLLLPNAGHWLLRLWLLLGRFPYVKNSPTDESHIRFYTVYEAKRICQGLGMKVEAIDGSASVWVPDFYPSWLQRRHVRSVYTWAARKMPSLLARDFILVCRK